MSSTVKENQSKQTLEESKAENSEAKYHIIPKYGVWTNDDSVVIQIAVPGVEKDAINIQVAEDLFHLQARRDNILYKLDLEFGIRLEPQVSKATYEEGLLKVELKRYKPLEHAFNVKIE
ncbi:MAG: Hsp20/alpha crystallin family protein [Promethearchaeota archaeon]